MKEASVGGRGGKDVGGGRVTSEEVWKEKVRVEAGVRGRNYPKQVCGKLLPWSSLTIYKHPPPHKEILLLRSKSSPSCLLCSLSPISQHIQLLAAIDLLQSSRCSHAKLVFDAPPYQVFQPRSSTNTSSRAEVPQKQ